MPKDAKLKEITVAELRLSRARLGEKAARLREQQAGAVATSPSGLALAREVRGTQERADDYDRILAACEAAGLL